MSELKRCPHGFALGGCMTCEKGHETPGQLMAFPMLDLKGDEAALNYKRMINHIEKSLHVDKLRPPTTPPAAQLVDELAHQHAAAMGMVCPCKNCGGTVRPIKTIISKMMETAPTHHVLKLEQPYFDLTWTGQKSYEVRLNDRKFKTGDTVELLEYDSKTDCYSGAVIYATIKSVCYLGNICGPIRYQDKGKGAIVGLQLCDISTNWKFKCQTLLSGVKCNHSFQPSLVVAGWETCTRCGTKHFESKPQKEQS